MIIWVNVFYAPYTNKTRFYLSHSYPTKRAALAALGLGAIGKKGVEDRYYDTIRIKL